MWAAAGLQGRWALLAGERALKPLPPAPPPPPLPSPPLLLLLLLLLLLRLSLLLLQLLLLLLLLPMPACSGASRPQFTRLASTPAPLAVLHGRPQRAAGF